jgi:hypothetical protein
LPIERFGFMNWKRKEDGMDLQIASGRTGKVPLKYRELAILRSKFIIPPGTPPGMSHSLERELLSAVTVCFLADVGEQTSLEEMLRHNVDH